MLVDGGSRKHQCQPLAITFRVVHVLQGDGAGHSLRVPRSLSKLENVPSIEGCFQR